MESEDVEIIDEKAPEPSFKSFKEYADYFLKDQVSTLTEGECLQHLSIYRRKTGESLDRKSVV